MSGKLRGKPPKPEVLEREAEVLKLRRGGMPFDLIAQRTGYATASGAKAAFDRAMARLIHDDVDALRALASDRLDMATAAIWSKVLQADLGAINTWIKIEERRSKLLGLDLPTRQQIELVTYDGNAVKAELERILASRSDSGPQSIVASGSSESEPTTTGE